MSTAILISGQLRTFAQCYPSQRWHVLRHFPDCHFFITVQRQPDADEMLAPLIADYGLDHVHVDLRDDPKLTVTPAMSVAYDYAPYANAAPPHQLLLQHWYQWQVFKHFREMQVVRRAVTREPQCFETVIRLRSDLWFHSFDCPSSALGPLSSEHQSTVFVPWWGEFGGINDRFAIMGYKAAEAYFTVFNRISELLQEAHCPFHPESLLMAALEAADVEIHRTLRTEFTTLRANGQQRPPEIMPWDLAHAALRAA